MWWRRGSREEFRCGPRRIICSGEIHETLVKLASPKAPRSRSSTAHKIPVAIPVARSCLAFPKLVNTLFLVSLWRWNMLRSQALGLIAATLSLVAPVFAADPIKPRDIVYPEYYVCWGNVGCTPAYNPYPGSPRFRNFACYSGGSSGFSPQVVCSALCGVGPCRITPAYGGSGGECGFRWAKAACRN
jgi:hypothetical protein